MPETTEIRPTDLLIDENNPRLPQPNTGQRKAYRSLVGQDPRKILALAKDIVAHGLNPADLPIVMPLKGSRHQHIVLEGNRRIAALKALENPESLAGAVSTKVLDGLRTLSRRYQDEPIEDVNCLVVRNREEANHWVELRHTGQNEGAGIVPWGSEESARFRARTGDVEPHIQVLDWLQAGGHLNQQDRRRIPVTNLKRLLSTPAVREKLGVNIKGGEFRAVGRADLVAKALMYVIEDLASGNTKVEDIYTSKDRKRYARNLPKRIVVPKTGSSSDSATSARRSKKKTTKKRTRRKPYPHLIPGDCVLNVTDDRIRDIEIELRMLEYASYPNAAAVLFRVFIELSVDAYISSRRLSGAHKHTKLREKSRLVLNDLMSRRMLTREQAAPVRGAMQRDAFLAGSIDMMNQYVHNPYVFPSPQDLKIGWRNLQPFIVAMWSA